MAKALSWEKRQEWEQTICKQRESGLTIACWCRENNIAIHAFYYWKHKFFPKPTLDRSAFTEVSRDKYNVPDLKGTGITLEYQGIRVLLDKQFDLSALKQCLIALKDMKC